MASRPLSSKERLGNRRALLPAKYRLTTPRREKANRPLSSKERLGNRRALLPAKYRDHITLLEEPSSEKSNRNMIHFGGRCTKSKYDQRQKAVLRKSHKELCKANGIRCKNSCIASKQSKCEDALRACSLQAKSSYFRQQGAQVQRSSDDGNLNGYHVVPNDVHSESNGFSISEDSLYTSNNLRYHVVLDNKENSFLNLESDSEDTDQLDLALCISDFSNNPTEGADPVIQCFDLSLDSDTEPDFEDTVELEWDECEEGDDLFCSMQEEQCENSTEHSDDHFVYKMPEISYVSINNLTDFDESNEIYMDLPSHDDLSSATVEVLAVSSETIPDCDVKDTAATTGTVTVDQVCSNTVTAACFASSHNFTDEDVCSPLNVTINNELLDEQKQKNICSLPETHPTSDIGENESKCVEPTEVKQSTPEGAHYLPVENDVENTSEEVTPKTGQTHEEVFMEALENYKKSGGHDTSLEKFENKNFTIQHDSLSPNCQPSSIHAVLSSRTKHGRHAKKFKGTRRDYRRNHQSEAEKRQEYNSIKDINCMEDMPSSIVALCQRTLKANHGSGDTALHKACRNGRSDMALYYILDGTIDINTQDYAGWSALHEACNRGYYDIVELLIKHGANVNLSSHDGTRPIHDAIEGSQLEIVKILVENGADISVERDGKTLMNIAEQHQSKDVLDYLEEQCRNSHFTKENIDVQVQLAVDANPLNFSMGYNLEKFSLGEELDSPLFYIVPTIECNENPLIPLYNIAVPHKDSLRRHNFYLLEDITSNGFSSDEITASLNGLELYKLTIADFVEQISLSEISFVPIQLRCLPPSELVELVPQCSGIQNLLNYITENMDD